jgi:hypothetical protein
VVVAHLRVTAVLEQEPRRVEMAVIAGR